MLEAKDVMSGALITCPPDMSVTQVAKLMRDGNTGDVLVTKDRRLMGIVTDRDLAVRVAASEQDPRQVPVRDCMTRRVVTGEPHWKLDRLAKTMGSHQIRRIPIVDHGLLVGIVSLGDIALREKRKPLVARSLEQISEPGAIHQMRSGRGRGLVGLALALTTGTMVAILLSSKSGSEWVDHLQEGINHLQSGAQAFMNNISELQRNKTIGKSTAVIGDILRSGLDRIAALSS